MKRTLFALTAVALVLAAPVTAQEPTLEEVLDGHYEAIGGLDAWNGVKTAKMVGKMSFPGGMEAPFTMKVKRPGRLRIEFTVQGMTGMQVVDGDTAWQIMPFMGKPDAEVMPEEQAKNMKEQADFDGPLVNWEEDGDTLEYEGSVDMEGTAAHKVKVILSSGDVRYYYLDADYFLPIKIEGKTKIQGQDQDFEVSLGDYKEVDGLMLAHSIEQKPKGAPEGQMLTIDSVEVNLDLADDEFTMPQAGE